MATEIIKVDSQLSYIADNLMVLDFYRETKYLHRISCT